jgi:hypothetical protein
MLEEQLEQEHTRFAQFRSPGVGGREFRRVRAVVPDRSISPARVITYGLYEVGVALRQSVVLKFVGPPHCAASVYPRPMW